MKSIAKNARPVGVKAQKHAENQVPSPCTSVCRMGAASGLCDGCWRTLDEIAGWSRMDDDAKRAVWLNITQRRAGATP